VASSISALLAGEHKVVNIKWDGYHNHNPGTMNPIEHGECFVLEDGTEADLDFGHYERFSNYFATGKQSITRGKLNEMIAILEKEGKKYEGKTIEEIPHLRDLLLHYLEAIGVEQAADVVTFEIGGNVGDDSASLALHAARMLQHRYGKENVMYVHVAPMCYTIDDHEPKTRPIQRSLSELTSYGIEVDMLVVRTEVGQPLQGEQRRKISEASILNQDAIIEAQSLKTVYALPIEFLKQGVDKVIERTLHIRVPNMDPVWLERVSVIENPPKTIKVALCGKYTDVIDSYKSVREALTHAGAELGIGVELRIFNTESTDFDQLLNYDAVIVPGGYGTRGIEGKIKAIQVARENKIPYLGLCYGMQLAVVEFARNVCGLTDAHTTEANPFTSYPVISLLPEQQGVTLRSGTQRLGKQDARLSEGSLASQLYDSMLVSERHRHRFEVNPQFHAALVHAGLVISGVHALRNDIAEFIELPQHVHPFFIGTQAHPELKSTLLRPAPLFKGLVAAAMQKIAVKS
jgi:CTP synthase